MDDEGFIWTDLVNSIFSEEEAALILSIPLSYFRTPDTLIWTKEKNGTFTTKSAYHVAHSSGEDYGTGPASSKMDAGVKWLWKALWKACVPTKVKNCVWRCCTNALPTQANLQKRKVITTATCIFCKCERETVEHVLLECPRSVSIWFSSSLSLRTGGMGSGGFQIWMIQMAGELSKQSFDLALVLIWSIRKERNSSLWTGSGYPLSNPSMAP
ncbi:uncharacterized protein LOC125475583 [Pyrus x bretschneideri]|uniref:uncharacterized protein LOC125475583 n=1 Tax=Pyrus x bretschneideri TaxID=225117 RepID=UPI0020304402|nr:uncharacterized protein LOC125475583 [Pyrus x bretschneideri]